MATTVRSVSNTGEPSSRGLLFGLSCSLLLHVIWVLIPLEFDGRLARADGDAGRGVVATLRDSALVSVRGGAPDTPASTEPKHQGEVELAKNEQTLPSVSAARVSDVTAAGPARSVTDASNRILPRVPESGMYLAAKELDVQPLPRGEPPEYAMLFADYPMSGELVLDLWIEESGRVGSVAVVGRTFPAAISERISREFAAIAFIPGQKGGREVKCQIRMALVYGG